MADLKINNIDMDDWGIRMDKGFISALGCPPPMKSFIENSSRLEDGKRVLVRNPRVNARSLTLGFTIQGKTPGEYQKRKNMFLQELQKGYVDIQVPTWSSDIFHLVYTGQNITYDESKSRLFGKMMCKFEEPNPAHRI